MLKEASIMKIPGVTAERTVTGYHFKIPGVIELSMDGYGKPSRKPSRPFPWRSTLSWILCPFGAVFAAVLGGVLLSPLLWVLTLGVPLPPGPAAAIINAPVLGFLFVDGGALTAPNHRRAAAYVFTLAWTALIIGALVAVATSSRAGEISLPVAVAVVVLSLAGAGVATYAAAEGPGYFLNDD